MTLLRRVVATLETAGIPAALVGAAAMSAHGALRSTLDIDLLTTDLRVLDAELWSDLRVHAGVDVRRGDAEDPFAGVVRFERPNERVVDLLVGRPAWQRRAVARAEPLSIEGVSLRVATPVDLVLLKLFAGGAQDAWDVRELLEALAPNAWAPRSSAIWRACRRRPGALASGFVTSGRVNREVQAGRSPSARVLAARRNCGGGTCPGSKEPGYSCSDCSPRSKESGYFELALINRKKRLGVAGADVLRARADQPVVGVLLEDVRRPP